MSRKRAQFIADPIVDFWAVIIYVLLAIILIIIYSVLGGCSGDFETGEIRQAESSASSEYLLLNFLQTPIELEETDIKNPNIADLILLAQSNEQNKEQLQIITSRYFKQNYYPWWEMKITYPSHEIIEFEGDNNPTMPAYSNTDIIPESNNLGNPEEVISQKSDSDTSSFGVEEEIVSNDIKNNWMTRRIENSASSAYKLIKSDISYISMEDKSIIAFIPSMSDNSIKIELKIKKYPSYPIFHYLSIR